MRLAQLRLCSLGSYGHTGLEPRSHSGGQKGKSMATLQYLLVICTSCIQHSFAGPNSVGLCHISVYSLIQYLDFIQIQLLDSIQTQFDAATKNWNFIQISVQSPNFSARFF